MQKMQQPGFVTGSISALEKASAKQRSLLDCALPDRLPCHIVPILHLAIVAQKEPSKHVVSQQEAAGTTQSKRWVLEVQLSECILLYNCWFT